MVNKASIVNNFPLDRSYYYPTGSDGLLLERSKALTAATAFTIKVDLNGTSLIKFYISEEGNANNIGGFNLSAKFYEDNGKEITGSAQTVAVPATTKNTNQYVDITGPTYITTGNYCIIAGTIPYTAAITVTVFAKGIFEASIDLSTLEDGIDNVNSAIATLNSNISAVIYVDGAAFTYSASKTLATGGVVNPTRAASDGDIVPMAMNAQGEPILSTSDEIVGGQRIINLLPAWERQGFETLASVTNGTDGTYHYYVDMEGYNRLSLFFDVGITSGNAVFSTLGTIQNDGTTASAITSYEDISTAYLGGAKTITSASAIDFGAGDGAGIVNNFKYIDIKVVATASNTADWIIYEKKWWEG